MVEPLHMQETAFNFLMKLSFSKNHYRFNNRYRDKFAPHCDYSTDKLSPTCARKLEPPTYERIKMLELFYTSSLCKKMDSTFW